MTRLGRVVVPALRGSAARTVPTSAAERAAPTKQAPSRQPQRAGWVERPRPRQ